MWTRFTRSLLAAWTALALLSASVAPALEVCAARDGGCPCEEHSQPDSWEAPCCCVSGDPDGLPAREATQVPLRPTLDLAGLAFVEPATSVEAPPARERVVARRDVPRPAPPLHLRHCSLLI